MRHVLVKVLLFAACAATLVRAEPADSAPVSPFSFTVSPSLLVPIGTGAGDYGVGGGSKLSTEYALPVLQSLALRAGILYGYQTVQEQVGSLSELGAIAGVSWRFPIVGGLSASVFADAGYSFSVINGEEFNNGGGSALVDAGAGLAYAFSPNLGMRLDLSYQHYFDMYGSLCASVSLSVTPPAPRKAALPSRPTGLEFGDIALQSVFPIFHTWYDQNPVGRIAVKNAGKEAISHLSISFLIKQYMDAEKECVSIESLDPGESREVPLYALFNGSVLDVTEATKSIASVTATYTEGGESQSLAKTATVRIYNRNAMCWDDDRKAAAFVSSKDPWVQDFSTGVAAMVKKLMNASIDGNLQLAIAFHGALRLYGVSYTPNPFTPYSQTSTHPEVVDFVRFPRQTLLGKAGDCSDLSILYSALFESVGKETAFITVPGHIFMAVRLDMSPEEAKADVSIADDLIVRDGKVWLPIETTLRDKGLMDAWREGAREWRQCTEEKTAAFYLVHEAWKLYEPVGLAADSSTVKIPASDLVTQIFLTDQSVLLQQELRTRISLINGQMAKTGTTARNLNERGVVYAKFGSPNLADMDLQAALRAQPDYVPALLNLGNLARLKADTTAALSYYQRAAKIAPDNARLQINLTLAAIDAGDDAAASQAYTLAKKLDPVLAEKYASIGGETQAGTRAAQAAEKIVLWDTEE